LDFVHLIVFQTEEDCAIRLGNSNIKVTIIISASNFLLEKQNTLS